MIVVYLLIALSILIVVHEFGHFIVARLFGIRVERFSIGFGPKLLGIKKGETDYKVSAIPFGGYVKMSGDDISELDKTDEGGFYNKPVWQRACVVAAGPVMNLILCLVLMPVVFMVGMAEPGYLHDQPIVIGVKAGTPAAEAGIEKGDIILKVDGNDVFTWGEAIDDINTGLGSGKERLIFEIDRGGKAIKRAVRVDGVGNDPRGIGIDPLLFIANEAVLDKIVAGDPADGAGLQPGDKVLKIDGKPIGDWTDMVMAVDASGGKEIEMIVERGGEELTVKLTPQKDKLSERYIIGAQKDYSRRDLHMTTVRYGFAESVEKGMGRVENTAVLTFFVLGKLVTGRLSYKNLGGPIGIAKVVAKAAKYGLGNFIFFLGFLSFQLGILNLLPIPVLDGGHLVFFAIEGVRGRPLGQTAMVVAQNIGLGVIVMLFLLITFNDVRNIEYVREMINKYF